jgi:PAS domain S-box-containing protein
MEEALQASKANMAAAQQVGHFGSWELELDELSESHVGTLRWSDEMFRIAGLEPGSAAVTRHLFYSVVHPDDREAIRDAVKAAMKDRKQYSIAHRIVRPNGEERIVQEIAQLFIDESTGRPLKLVGTTHDITDRKHAENALRENEERFRLLSDATHDAIWDWRLETNEVWWSEGFEKLFGFVRTEGNHGIEPWVSRIHPGDRERVLKEVDRVLETGCSSWAGEYRFQRNDGTYAYVLDRGHVIRDADGKPVRLIGGMTDNTIRKRAEVELARTNRALQMLSACNESLVRATDEKQLLDDICRVAATIGGYRMAWVGYARHDESCGITPVASAGIGREYLSEIQLSWSDKDPTGRGPAGQTIRSGCTTVSQNISADTETFYWQAEALHHGFRSVVCLPLRDGERTFGLLGLYSGETNDGSSQELKLLQELADNLAFGICNLRTREARQRTQEVVLKVAQSVSTSSSEEFFTVLTRNMVDALDATCGAIGRINRENRRMVDTLSFIYGAKTLDNVSYDVSGTPCEGVTRGEQCVFEEKLQQCFPTDALLVDFGLESYAGIPLLSSKGEIVGLMSVMFDKPMEHTDLVLSTLRIFAARAAAEIGRQEADERNREQASLLDKARDAILVRDLQNRITYWNKSAERLYGWTSEEALGLHVSELLYRDDTEFHAATKRVLEAGEWMGELNQVDRRGRELTIEGRWTLVQDSEGRSKSILAINTDITERKKLEAQF